MQAERVGRRVAISMLAIAVTGCVVVPAQPHQYYVGTVVATAPPPPRVEVYGVAPGPDYVWLGGYWSWAGGRHEWVGGHWEHGRPHQRWVAHRWVHERDGWHLSEGHWERR
jgi:YXWGXW repeat-containing protein